MAQQAQRFNEDTVLFEGWFKTLKVLFFILLVITLVASAILKACPGKSPEQTRNETTKQQVAQAATSELAYQQLVADATKMNSAKTYPQGNALEPPTIIHERNSREVEISINGTNEYFVDPKIRFHQTGMSFRLEAGQQLAIMARCLNDQELDYNAWGNGTKVWGLPRGLYRLMTKEDQIAFFEREVVRPWVKYPGRFFGAAVLALIDRSNNQAFPGNVVAWKAFQRGETLIHLNYTAQKAVEVEVVIHRNLHLQAPSSSEPGVLENQNQYSGWRGAQYWRFTINVLNGPEAKPLNGVVLLSPQKPETKGFWATKTRSSPSDIARRASSFLKTSETNVY
ncbi:hypothetical protein C4553_02515 [Candidatus Parcubacteria bacterium]|nr:MAG: hypothetical protein C4553_02515 [Candidatus Parcubacteria bacterium]